MELNEEMIQLLGEEAVWPDEPMSRHTSFRVGGCADYYLTPRKDQIRDLLALCERSGIPVTVIGNGSNLLVGDGGIRGAVVEIGANAARIRVEDTVIFAEAGAGLARAAQEAARASLTGLEFASGIPGTVGGAVVMNAGAYGGEIKDILLWADVMDEKRIVHRLSAEELDLSYRHSMVMDRKWIVLEAALSLTKGDPAAIRARMEELRGQRLAKQPLEYPSAGSTFRRPQGYFAGKLIMDAGLRGYSVGGAQVSEKHCGFVINKGNATAEDILCLMEQVQERVKKAFGVSLEPEVKLVGEFPGREKPCER